MAPVFSRITSLGVARPSDRRPSLPPVLRFVTTSTQRFEIAEVVLRSAILERDDVMNGECFARAALPAALPVSPSRSFTRTSPRAGFASHEPARSGAVPVSAGCQCPRNCSRRWRRSARSKSTAANGASSPGSMPGRCATGLRSPAATRRSPTTAPTRCGTVAARSGSRTASRPSSSMQRSGHSKSGHSKASLLTDVYGHVMVEPAGDEWRSFWLDAYDTARRPRAVERLPGVAPVRPGMGA